MDINLIQQVCGVAPIDFVKIVPTDSNYIFKSDPNFLPINLYDFFGRAATVNSYEECYYYLELGFEPIKFTIFDILYLGIILCVTVFLIYKIYSKKYYLKLYAFFKSIKSILLNSKLQSFLFVVFLLIQNYFIFNYVKNKSFKIPMFIDEYISLASNISFFTKLDFNAGSFVGGSFSVLLTSGPISALGGVLGWQATHDFIFARVANYYWIILIQLVFSLIILKSYKLNFKFLISVTGLFITLVPWWQGSLYMIGEFASVIFFLNAIFLFSKFRFLSLILFSISIFYGKLLTILPFAIFYSFWVFINKEQNKVLKDIFIFSIPLTIWLGFVAINYSNGNIYNYLNDLINLIIGHQSSGTNPVSLFDSLQNSEVSNWNQYDIIRLLFIPVLFGFIVIKNKNHIDRLFGNISIPLVASVVSIYLWFWLLSPTKWMRYSQHFSIIVILFLIYLINFDLIHDNTSIFLSSVSIVFFIENTKQLIFIGILVLFVIVYIQTTYKRQLLIKLFLAFLLTLDLSLAYYDADINNMFFEEDNKVCIKNIVSDECRDYYLNK